MSSFIFLSTVLEARESWSRAPTHKRCTLFDMSLVHPSWKSSLVMASSKKWSSITRDLPNSRLIPGYGTFERLPFFHNGNSPSGEPARWKIFCKPWWRPSVCWMRRIRTPCYSRWPTDPWSFFSGAIVHQIVLTKYGDETVCVMIQDILESRFCWRLFIIVSPVKSLDLG